MAQPFDAMAQPSDEMAQPFGQMAQPFLIMAVDGWPWLEVAEASQIWLTMAEQWLLWLSHLIFFPASASLPQPTAEWAWLGLWLTLLQRGAAEQNSPPCKGGSAM